MSNYKNTCPSCKAQASRSVGSSGQVHFCESCKKYFSVESSFFKRQEQEFQSNSTAIKLNQNKDLLRVKIRWIRNHKYFHSLGESPLDIFNIFGATAAFLLNSTYITVSKTHIKIEHKPLDIQPFTYFPIGYVKQFFVQRNEYATDRDDMAFDFGYGLYAIVKDGSEVPIIWNMKLEALLYLEREIELAAGIRNIEVEGEYVDN